MINGIPIALGSAYFGTAISPGDSCDILSKFASLGGRIIDTANMYACWHPKGQGGDSEKVIGDWLQKTKNSSEFTVISKIGSHPALDDNDCDNPEGLSPEVVYQAVDKSLARLQTDQLDVLLAHHDDHSTPLYDTWNAFTELVKNGKVKKIGISNYKPKRVIELSNIIQKFSLAPISVVELKYSVISPIENSDFGNLCLLDQPMKKVLKEVVPQAQIVGYSPLLGGLFEKDAQLEWPAEYDTPENRRKIEMLQQEAKLAGVSTSAYVIKKIVDQGILPVLGVENIEQLERNLMAWKI